MTQEEKAAIDYARERLSNEDYPYYNDEYEIMLAFEAGVEWCRNNLWKDAQGDDLPEIDREVIALLTNSKVCFAHRPNPDGWDGKSITTGEVKHYDVQTYDNGGWNIPDVKYWLDAPIPQEGGEK